MRGPAAPQRLFRLVVVVGPATGLGGTPPDGGVAWFCDGTKFRERTGTTSKCSAGLRPLPSGFTRDTVAVADGYGLFCYRGVWVMH